MFQLYVHKDKGLNRFASSPAAAIVSRAVPDAIGATAMAEGYVVQGSAGKGDWTHTPWVAVLDRAESRRASTSFIF